MKNILFILLTVTVFMTSCGNIEDTDGKIGNESKETENTENIKDKAEDIMDDASDAVDDVKDEMTDAVSSSVSDVKRITTEQAQSVAFSDAGKTCSEVTIYKTYLYNDKGRVYYDVEFADDHTMFEYEIDSVSANILKKEQSSVK